MTARSLESPGIATQSPFWFAIFFTASVANSLSRSFKITFAPAFASLLQISRPIPCPAPVTMATLPVKDIKRRDNFFRRNKTIQSKANTNQNHFFFLFADFFLSLFLDEIDFTMVCPWLICFLSFTFANELAKASFTSFLM